MIILVAVQNAFIMKNYTITQLTFTTHVLTIGPGLLTMDNEEGTSLMSFPDM